jgi:hypothetical protein
MHYEVSHIERGCVWCSCTEFKSSSTYKSVGPIPLDKIYVNPETTRAAEIAYGFKALIEPAKDKDGEEKI